MNREENQKNELINMMNKIDNNENEKKEEIKAVNYMKKYCNEEWNNFFKENISEKIKLYEEKLCYTKNTNNSFGDSKDDLFVNGYNDDDNNNNETENLLGRYTFFIKVVLCVILSNTQEDAFAMNSFVKIF